MDANTRDWLDQPKYRPGLSMFMHMDEQSAERLYIETQNRLALVGICICHAAEIRRSLPEIPVAALAEAYQAMCFLIDALEQTGGSWCDLATPAVAELRDFAASEGIRRGAILTAGENAIEAAYAECMALYVAAIPVPAEEAERQKTIRKNRS